jgi:hypothetical protein
MIALTGTLGQQVRSTHAERACLDALPRNAGFQFTAAVQRSRRARRPVNAGLLALSILPDEVRRGLLAEWITSGAGTSSFFAAQGDALLDFIAKQLPDPSPELAVCRFEQFALRANSEVGSFKAPDRLLFGLNSIVRRAHHAGMVHFSGEPQPVLEALLERKPLPPFSPHVTALLVAPGLQPLCRIASPHEDELWAGLTEPTAAAALVQGGCPRTVIETMLRAGALEYA